MRWAWTGGDPLHFYETISYAKRAEKKGAGGGWATAYKPSAGAREADFALIDADSAKRSPAGTKISARNAKSSPSRLKTLLLAPRR